MVSVERLATKIRIAGLVLYRAARAVVLVTVCWVRASSIDSRIDEGEPAPAQDASAVQSYQ